MIEPPSSSIYVFALKAVLQVNSICSEHGRLQYGKRNASFVPMSMLTIIISQAAAPLALAGVLQGPAAAS